MRLAVVCMALLFLSGCKETVKQETPIKAVKTIVAESVNSQNRREISGILETLVETDLSFLVGGRVIELNVKQGDTVKKGQVLAKIESDDYQLAVKSARAELEKAKTALKQQKESLRRTRALLKDDYVSESEIEQAEARYQASGSNVEVAESQLNDAELRLDRTVLKAPYAGTISSRHLDPFVTVSSGTLAFRLVGDKGFEVDLLVPETIIRDLNYDQKVSVTFPTLKGVELPGVVSEISVNAQTGNAFPVKVELEKIIPELRPGLTSIVAFTYSRNEDASKILLPISAVDFRFVEKGKGPIRDQVPIFVFDQKTSTVKLRRVKVQDIRGNEVEVVAGLEPGEIVVVAGSSFLIDGQKVKLWKPKYSPPAELMVE